MRRKVELPSSISDDKDDQPSIMVTQASTTNRTGSTEGGVKRHGALNSETPSLVATRDSVDLTDDDNETLVGQSTGMNTPDESIAGDARSRRDSTESDFFVDDSVLTPNLLPIEDGLPGLGKIRALKDDEYPGRKQRQSQEKTNRKIETDRRRREAEQERRERDQEERGREQERREMEQERREMEQDRRERARESRQDMQEMQREMAQGMKEMEEGMMEMEREMGRAHRKRR
jgi:hypothetical protein